LNFSTVGVVGDVRDFRDVRDVRDIGGDIVVAGVGFRNVRDTGDIGGGIVVARVVEVVEIVEDTPAVCICSSSSLPILFRFGDRELLSGLALLHMQASTFSSFARILFLRRPHLLQL